MSEALKKAREALSLARSEIWRLLDVKGVHPKQASEWPEIVLLDAALAAIDAEAKPVVRMLTDVEFEECCGGCKVTSAAMTWMRRSVSKAAEVWGLTIGEQG